MASNGDLETISDENLATAQQRLAEIDDLLKVAPRDALAERIALTDEADALRKALLETDPEIVAVAQAKWAGRAGHKGLHEIDPEIAKGVALGKGYGDGGGHA